MAESPKRKRDEEPIVQEKRRKVDPEEEIDYDNPVEEEENVEAELEEDGQRVTEFLVVTQLKRPFSPAELKDYLETPLECWINKNRSLAVAKYPSPFIAKTIKAKIHGVRWPSPASNALEAIYISEEESITVKETGVYEKKEKKEQEENDKAFREQSWLLKHFNYTTTEPRLYWCPASTDVENTENEEEKN
eukprot:TRINITY_DN11907_c0_g1_i1.p1 TRINITY_DN11907_c0_g1~~TRINITY_DN11907_c0_g1_i1.p1  ORF type:complete len:191 (+),score=51.92 TRINITY_DN11907_c0_g1_i1:15-587(+)